MSISEITEEGDEEAPRFLDKDQKKSIRRILAHQKYLYCSSSSSSTSALSSSSAGFSSLSSSWKSSSLLDLMKGRSTSLRRLFVMEHTSSATYVEESSGSPMINPIPLWGSDSDCEHFGPTNESVTDGQTKLSSEGSFLDGEYVPGNRKVKFSSRSLTRKESFGRLPGFGLWRCRGYRFSFRLKRLRIMICGRKLG